MLDETKLHKVKRLIPLADAPYHKHIVVLQIESVADTHEEAAELLIAMVMEATHARVVAPIKAIDVSVGGGD